MNAKVDETLASTGLKRILALVEATYSNSMIEAWWRALKHQWLYLNALDSFSRLRELVAFCVEAHNTQMPRSAFDGQTPNEVCFGTAPNLGAELKAAPGHGAREASRREPSRLLPAVRRPADSSLRSSASLGRSLLRTQLQNVVALSSERRHGLEFWGRDRSKCDSKCDSRGASRQRPQAF